MEDNDVVLKSFFEKLVDEYNKNDFNIGTCLSLLSYIFKLNIGNDNLVQNFEVHFCRKNFYKLNSLADIVDVIDTDCNEKEKVNFDVFRQISLFLLSVIEKENKENNNGELSNFDEIIGEIRGIIRKSSEKQANDDKKLQTNFDDTAKERYFELSPTGGIAKLNNNPYSFFLDKVLGISDIEEWNEYFDAKTYGNLVHKIMQNFAYACIKKK